MRVVLHDYGGYAFTRQLGRALADRGHEVLYLHGGGLRPPRGVMDPRSADPPTLSIERVELNEPLRSRAGPARLFQERRYGRVLAQRITVMQPDVVLSVPSSLDAQAAAQRAARRVGSAFVFWLQDLYSQAIERLVARQLPVAGAVIAARFARLERTLLRRSDAVVAITDDFLPILRRWHILGSQIVVEPNWAPLDEVEVTPKDNPWSREHGFAEYPVFLYAGTLGRKHDPQLLVALADELPEARVVVVSEGAGTERLRTLAAGRGNVDLLPLQPAERLGDVLASADVLVALLDSAANVFSVPSKVLTYLTAGRPILAAIPAVNRAARTINEAKAGVVVDPSNVTEFVAAGRDLLANPAWRVAAGVSGREYAERAFEIEAIADRFESVLEAARHTNRSHAARMTDTSEAQ